VSCVMCHGVLMSDFNVESEEIWPYGGIKGNIPPKWYFHDILPSFVVYNSRSLPIPQI
jgi:hypothetical protein